VLLGARPPCRTSAPQLLDTSAEAFRGLICKRPPAGVGRSSVDGERPMVRRPASAKTPRLNRAGDDPPSLSCWAWDGEQPAPGSCGRVLLSGHLTSAPWARDLGAALGLRPVPACLRPHGTWVRAWAGSVKSRAAGGRPTCLPCKPPLAALAHLTQHPAFWPTTWAGWRCGPQPGRPAWCWRAIGRGRSRPDGSLAGMVPGLSPKPAASPAWCLGPGPV